MCNYNLTAPHPHLQLHNKNRKKLVDGHHTSTEVPTTITEQGARHTTELLWGSLYHYNLLLQNMTYVSSLHEGKTIRFTLNS